MVFGLRHVAVDVAVRAELHAALILGADADLIAHVLLRHRHAAVFRAFAGDGALRHRDGLATMHSFVDKAIEILSGDVSKYDDFGRLLQESWRIKRSLSNKVSTESIDEIYQRAIAAGALGGKLLGAGGGGFILFFVPPENQQSVRAELSDLLQVPFRFDTLGTQLIYYTEE